MQGNRWHPGPVVLFVFSLFGCGDGPLEPPCPQGASTVVTDIAGTLTVDDDAFNSLNEPGGAPPDPRPDAAALFTAWRAAGWHVVYLSADGDDLVYPDGRAQVDVYADWLESNGFPREQGDLLLADGFGVHEEDIVHFKQGALADLAAVGLAVEVGYGNDDWDAQAYAELETSWILGDSLAEADAFAAHLDAVDIPDRCVE